METLLLGPDDVAESADLAAVIDAVEDAFAAYARGDAQMPAKSYIDLPEYNGDFRSMPAHLATDPGEPGADEDDEGELQTDGGRDEDAEDAEDGAADGDADDDFEDVEEDFDVETALEGDEDEDSISSQLGANIEDDTEPEFSDHLPDPEDEAAAGADEGAGEAGSADETAAQAAADDGPEPVQREAWEGAGIKWVNSHPDNPDEHDLPTVMGTMIYSDPETALPLAIMDGTTLTRLRTGAAAAVATRHLAKTDASTLGLVGAGIQSYTQLEAIAQVRDIETVVIADVDEDAKAAFRERYADEYDVHEGSIEQAAACDVVSTTTPVREPIVHGVGNGTHVNAMGADAEGKHEIADEVLRAARLVIDDYAQCTHSGEINVPWSQGKLDDGDIHAALGDVVVGEAEGRADDDQITLFDSTGLAIQDVAAAHVVYEGAQEAGLGTEFELVGTET